MKLPYWLISRLPSSWKWVRKNLGGKWQLESHYHMWSGETATWIPVAKFFGPYWSRILVYATEDYTPMLPMPTELTGYRG